MSDELPSAALRVKAARVLRLTRTVADEKARASLLDYAQELVDRAEQLEQEASVGQDSGAPESVRGKAS